jgi:hypothetical protein
MSPASGWLASTGTVSNTHTLAYPRATVCGQGAAGAVHESRLRVAGQQRHCTQHTHLHILELLSVVRERRVRFMSPASGWLASTGTVPNTHTLAYSRATISG